MFFGGERLINDLFGFSFSSVNGPAPPNPGSGSPRLATHLKHHLLQKGYGNQSPTSPQNFVNGPGMHQPMGPPQMQHVRMQVCITRRQIFGRTRMDN